jgi:VWFA-related protein
MTARAFLLALLVATFQQPAAPSSAGLFVIEAQVFQRDGTPLAGLKPEQLEVFVDDKPRPVVSVDLRGTHTGPRIEGNSGIDRFPGGRVVMLAVDQASFPPSAAGAVIEAAQRIVAGVPAHDYLGIVVFPEWASAVPTRDREAVRQILGKVSGIRRDVSAPRFDISASDALLLRSRDATALQTIVMRECESAFSPTCRNEVLQDGSAIAEVLEHQHRSSLTGLFAALDAVAALPERKAMILLSAGLPMVVRPGTRLDQSADVSRVVQMTTVANVDLNVVYLNGRFLRHYAPEYRKRHYAIFDDLRTFGASLQLFAESSGGSFLQMEITADPVLDRLLRGPEASYDIGVQLRPEDRDGQAHTVRINVKLRGATARYRRVVTIPPVSGQPVVR